MGRGVYGAGEHMVWLQPVSLPEESSNLAERVPSPGVVEGWGRVSPGMRVSLRAGWWIMGSCSLHQA